MKTKVFKSVLPLLVMILAIGLSFATQSPTVDQLGYFQNSLSEWQSIVVGPECGLTGDEPCLYMDKQLYTQPDIDSPAFLKNH